MFAKQLSTHIELDKSTGLGLYIVKKAVERSGGTIYAQDNTPKGSLFVLKLKAAQESPSSKA